MIVLLTLLATWLVLGGLGLVGASALCRSGHLEDEARGFVAPEELPVQPEVALQVTHK
jgi:hypothetical protein